MSVQLNHIIIHSRDNRESATFLADILGLDIGTEWGPFLPVDTANGVTLDFATIPAESIVMQHYAFLISEAEFDTAFARIQQAGLTYYADPHGKHPGEINHNDGGRGVYFFDPAGHAMEIITRPYGGDTPQKPSDAVKEASGTPEASGRPKEASVGAVEVPRGEGEMSGGAVEASDGAVETSAGAAVEVPGGAQATSSA